MDGSARDLAPAPFPSLAWEDGARAKSLELLFRHVTGEAERAIAWYWRARRRGQRGGRALRLAAILSAGAAGMLPLLAEVLERDGHPLLDPLWGALLLAGAGLLVLLDRFWGFTRSWVRSALAAQEVAAALDVFRIDWEAARLTGDGAEPDVETTQAALERCRRFLLEVRAIVRRETHAWAADFECTLAQIDTSARSRLPPGTER